MGSLEAGIGPLKVRVDKCTCDLFENGVKFVKSDFDRLWALLGLLGPFEAQRGGRHASPSVSTIDDRLDRFLTPSNDNNELSSMRASIS